MHMDIHMIMKSIITKNIIMSIRMPIEHLNLLCFVGDCVYGE